MASGRPSRAAQIAATAASASPAGANAGATARARATNSRTASLPDGSVAPPESPAASARGGTRSSCSP